MYILHPEMEQKQRICAVEFRKWRLQPWETGVWLSLPHASPRPLQRIRHQKAHYIGTKKKAAPYLPGTQ